MKNRRRGNVFLLELMIAIFFFAIIAAVCTQLFSEAYTLSRKSGDLTEAVNLSTNYAENFRSWNGTEEQWEDLFPEGEWKENVWYGREEDDLYTIITLEEDEVPTARISIYRLEEEQPIYELLVANREAKNGKTDPNEK